MRPAAPIRLATVTLLASFAICSPSGAEPLQLDPSAQIRVPDHKASKPPHERAKARHAPERAQVAPAALLPTPAPIVRRDAEPAAGLPHQLQFGTVTVTPGGFLEGESRTRR